MAKLFFLYATRGAKTLLTELLSPNDIKKEAKLILSDSVAADITRSSFLQRI